ncbi:MAG: MFS transporter [Clostridium sp.]|nr:MFS transporter [Clostridium sp.]
MEIEKEINSELEIKGNPKLTSNIILLLLGRLVSLFGSQIYNFAIGLYVLKTTGSSAAFSMTLVFGMLPRIILGPVAGVISDRVDRKKIVVAMDILSGVVIFALAAVASINGLKVSYIYIANLLLNTCNTFFDIPMGASIPNIVDDKSLVKVNSLNQAVSSMAQIGGPFLGGIIFALVDIKLFLVVNAISFVLSGISEMFIDFNLNKVEKEDKNREKDKVIKGFSEEFKEGFTFLKGRKVLSIIFGFSIFLNFFLALGVTVPFPYIVNNIINLSPKKFGILEAMIPLGMMIGSIILSMLPEKEKKYKSLVIGIMFISVTCISIALPVLPRFVELSKSVHFIYYIIFLLIGGISIVYVNIPIFVIMQRETPDNIRGRIFGLLQTIAMGINPIGLILSGLLIEKIPVYILPVASGIIMIFITLLMASNKEIKTI